MFVFEPYMVLRSRARGGGEYTTREKGRRSKLPPILKTPWSWHLRTPASKVEMDAELRRPCRPHTPPLPRQPVVISVPDLESLPQAWGEMTADERHTVLRKARTQALQDVLQWIKAHGRVGTPPPTDK